MVHGQRFLDLLRCHVMRRAHRVLGAGERLLAGFIAHHLRNAEVRNLHPARFVEQDVLRLDVAVDDALLMRVLQRLADFRHNRQRLFRRHFPGLQQLSQIQAVHKFHQQIVQLQDGRLACLRFLVSLFRWRTGWKPVRRCQSRGR